jgi:hypothetical protein
MTNLDELLRWLPGEEIIRPGMQDLANRRETAESLLIEIAESRMRAAGLPVPAIPPAAEAAELRLCALLSAKYGREARYQYDALTQRVDEFCRFLEFEKRGHAGAPPP